MVLLGYGNFAEILKKTCQLNPKAGIHYNVGRDAQKIISNKRLLLDFNCLRFLELYGRLQFKGC